MSSTKEGYKGIFKSTFLFGGVQVVNVLIKIVLNKLVAVFLGPSGIGMIGMYQSAINTLKTFGDVGVSQSSVKDISELNGKPELSKKVQIVNRLGTYTGIFGLLLTVFLAPKLSFWIFNDTEHTHEFLVVSITVFFYILGEIQLSILKGLRHLHALAKSSILSTLIGCFFAAIVYYYFKHQGIVFALLFVSLFYFLVPKLFVYNLKIKKVVVSAKTVWNDSRLMLKMGATIMITSFLAFFVEFLLKSYILKHSTIEIVGMFQVGSTILTGYFGIVITALITDYYPRISAINQDDLLLEKELNRQIKVGFLMLGPLVVCFLLCSNFFLELFYSKKFILANDFIIYAIYGVLFTIASNPMDMILVAKSKAKLFLIVSLIYRFIHLIVFIVGFNLWGLKGLGIAHTFLILIHFVIMYLINLNLFNIKLHRKTMSFIGLVLLYTFLAALIVEYSMIFWIKLILALILVFVSLFTTTYLMKVEMGIDVFKFINGKLSKFKKN